MSKVKIETLTSVHIGSGETLQYGNDFVKGKADDDDMIGIIDPKKVMQLIGEDKIDAWVIAIDNGRPTDQIVKQYAPKAKIEDYSQRLILPWFLLKNTDTLKEQIYDGLGRPYIPGSSIKGAIRTAVLASMLNQETGLENKIRDFKGKVTAKNVEFEFLGKDPNSDVFRFLQVGDAFFGDNYTVAIRMVNINERKSSGFWDESKSQLIEAICPEDESTFEMKLNSKLYDWAKDKVHKMPNCMSSLSELFKTINNHTKALITKDIQYWKNYSDIDDSGKVDNYIEKMCKMLSVTNVCKEGESCVLRIGYGSGWCFITGAWAKKLENFADDVVPASRPKNRNYSEYDFPKTRRVDDNCELLGFVKLSLVK